jgi:hypothetical protein
MEWVVNATPRPLYPGVRDTVPIIKEAGWAPGSIWTTAEILAPTGIRSRGHPARSESIYRLPNIKLKTMCTTKEYSLLLFTYSRPGIFWLVAVIRDQVSLHGSVLYNTKLLKVIVKIYKNCKMHVSLFYNFLYSNFYLK